MAIMFIRAEMISRGAGRSVVSAAAYRHRKKMVDERIGVAFAYKRRRSDLVHEELALPDQAPDWLLGAIDGRTVASASEVLWNAVEAFEKRVNAELARELIIALPEELTRAENIALVREFVRDNLTNKGMVVDWVYHERQGNPHIHLIMTLRPLTEDGFGPKTMVLVREHGQPRGGVGSDGPVENTVRRKWGGDRKTLKAWKIAWAETANRHLSLAGHDIQLDGRSYAERGLGGIAKTRVSIAKAVLIKKGTAMFLSPAELARRQEVVDRLLADPELLLKQISNERSTFDQSDIAKALHRHVDDSTHFANIHAKLLMSDELVVLKPQQLDPETGRMAEPAIFTTRDMLRVEFEMARSAEVLSKRVGFAAAEKHVAAAIRLVETRDPQLAFRLDGEQIGAIRHIVRDNGIAAVVGLAGTGKSTLLEAARIAWEKDGRRVVGAALAGKAAEGLEKNSGIRSRTLAAWEVSWGADRDSLGRGDVFVIDEAGLVSSRQMARVLKVVEDAGAKVVLVGDAMQLQPIQAGAAFRAIVERIGFAELAGVRRQHEDWARDASYLFAVGRVEAALDLYAAQGHITETNSKEEAIGRIVVDWTKARIDLLGATDSEDSAVRVRGDELLVLAHTNADVKRLNEAVRAVMVERGILHEQHVVMTERGKREFAVGDRIIFLENARFVEPRAGHLGPQHVKNGMLGTVRAITGRDAHTLLSVRLDNGRKVVFGEHSYRNIDYGYAATIHKSQGATVDRTFVLATGAMDRHLTYVAMTRHRERADLYAAKEDFVPRRDWEKLVRIDHAAGLSGELVAVGQARFRDDTDANLTPYADVNIEGGKKHRVWGVGLPAALEKGGVRVGDVVSLRKDGIERVMVKVPGIDTETGETRFEDRLVERNVWTAQRLEHAGSSSEFAGSQSHRPELFEPLVERLSRSGAKTVTLDYQNEASYLRHIDDFARRRGIVRLAEASAEVEEALSRQWARLVGRKERLDELWRRASVALGLAIERERRISYDEDRGMSQPAARKNVVGVPRYLMAPTMTFPQSLEEDARLAQMASREWKEREASLWSALNAIYRDPDQALIVLNRKILANDGEPRRIIEALARVPDQLGRLRGSEDPAHGGMPRHELHEAMAAVANLIPLARAHAEAFRVDAGYFERREQIRRSAMSVSVPALSENALVLLSEIDAGRMKGGEDAYKSAFSLAAENSAVMRELNQLGEALTARFGRSAFTSKPDIVAERSMIERMPPNLTSEQRGELVKLFELARHFAEVHQGERRNPSQVFATAIVSDDKIVLPMLSAVSEFRTPVEEEARHRALARSDHQRQRARLAESMTHVWRDPASAVETIEDLILKGISAKRIATAVRSDPTAYGALRGSGRTIDRLLAPGRERKDALQAIAKVDVHIKAFASSYAAAFDRERQAITEERRRMAIAIPGLSQSAQDELSRLTKATTLRSQDLDAAVHALDPQVRAEFAVISKALDARFGRNVIERGDERAANFISATQRQEFEVMREFLRVLQRAVRIGSQKIVEERNKRSINETHEIGN
ncbi:Ti-type conjugative transfer relaxase TraA [Rhizobium leucaenae]|uniref:Ti-type conjugative transfer relaxase TraA n=1 Tax=Rhizobium leucaenae TaxID=29450 RepID=UPI0016178FF2|nr:Ti-type conjugative transfer relaxase TraA [Rhizobium leucaenae]MBB6305300.1 Ti-type conjugative transfer relaxase TraA [Rhizobium leucaenae]